MTDYLTLPQASAILPGNPPPRTLRRWASEGLRDGKVKLRFEYVGGRVYVTRAELDRFFAAVRDIPRPGCKRLIPPTRAEKRSRQESRERLRRRGLPV